MMYWLITALILLASVSPLAPLLFGRTSERDLWPWLIFYTLPAGLIVLILFNIWWFWR